jgi:hypothetical protein
MAARALEKARDILRNHAPEALSGSVRSELVRVRTHAEKYLKDVQFTV